MSDGVSGREGTGDSPHRAVFRALKRYGAIALLPVLLLVALTTLLAGAQRGLTGSRRPPGPVRVVEALPDEVDLGDRFAVLGEGFPVGKAARLTFTGALHRPGERAIEGTEITVMATAATSVRVEFAFDEAARGLFCGVGDRASHTTFEGALQVAFAAPEPGAAPYGARLEHVTLDVHPGMRRSSGGQALEGERVLAFTGLHVTSLASRLLVDAVDPGSRADAAGIGPGDVVEAFDGVRASSAADLVPPPGERSASVVLRDARDGASRRLVTLPIDGFRRAPAAELLGATLLVVGALCAVVVLAAPLPGALAAPIQRLVSRIRRLGKAAGPCACKRCRTLTTRVDWAAGGLVVAAALGRPFFAARLDVALLFVATATALAAAAFVGQRGLWQGVQAAAHVAWQQMPAAAAVASVVVTTGSLGVQEIERAQGGAPWEWIAFRSPAALMALVLLLASAGVEPFSDHAPGGLAAWIEPAPVGYQSPAHGRPLWLTAVCRVHCVIVAALACTLFLGGRLLPCLSATEQDSRPLWHVAGAAWLIAKSYGLVVGMGWIRSLLPRRALAASSRETAIWKAPLALAVLAATAGWTAWGLSQEVQSLISAQLLASVALVGAGLLQRVASSTPDGHLSPFL